MRSNLHVLLLLGVPGSLALPPLTATALAQSLCSLEIYRSWNQESLLQVASKHLKGHFRSALRFTRGWSKSQRGAFTFFAFSPTLWLQGRCSECCSFSSHFLPCSKQTVQGLSSLKLQGSESRSLDLWLATLAGLSTDWWSTYTPELASLSLKGSLRCRRNVGPTTATAGRPTWPS